MALNRTTARSRYRQRRPFYSEDDESEQYEEVSEELPRTISAIDRSALSYNGFWVAFAGDVAIGDYATELIS
jgi:hypothetical protein